MGSWVAVITFASAAAASAFVADVATELDLPVSAARGGAREHGGGRHVPAADVLTSTVLEADGADVTVDQVVSASDSLATIQAAIDATPDGGILVFRAGTYTLGDRLVWGNGITTVAEGAVTLRRSGNANSPIELAGVRRGVFAGLTFDINAPENFRVMCNARGATDLRFTGCTWVNSGSTDNEWTLPGLRCGGGSQNIVVEDCDLTGVQLQVAGFGGSSGVRVSRCTFTNPLQYAISATVRGTPETQSGTGAAQACRDITLEDLTITYEAGTEIGSGAIFVGDDNDQGVSGACEDIVVRRITVENTSPDQFPNPYRAINARPPQVARRWTFDDITVTDNGAGSEQNTHGVLVGPRESGNALFEDLTISNVTGSTNLSRGALNFTEAQAPFGTFVNLSITSVTGPVFNGAQSSSVAALLEKYGA